MSRVVVMPSQLDEQPEEIPSHIGDGLLIKGALSSIVAESQAGKSFFLIHMACCMAMCLEFFGRPAWAEGVVIVVGEGFHGIPNRMRAWCAHYGVSLDRLDRRLAFVKVPLDISDDEMVARVLAELEEISFTVDVIMFDTLSSNAPPGFKINDPGDMKGYMDAARRLRDRLSCTVVFAAHTGQPNGAAAERGSGSYDRFASMDTELFIKNNGGIRTVTMSKSRDFPKLDNMRFELQPSEKSVVLVPVNGATGSNSTPGDLAPSARNALATLVETGMGMPISNQAWLYATKLQKTAYYGAKKALLAGGYVLQDGKGFIPTSRGDQLLKITAEVREPFHGVRQEVRPRPLIKGGGANEPNTEVRELRNELRANQRNSGPGLDAVPWEVFDGAA